MNAPFPHNLSQIDETERFDRLKLQLLQAFFELDIALEDWIHDGKGKSSGASTGCRLKELIEIDFPTSVASKAQSARFAKLFDELDMTIKTRNLVIHSEASFGQVDDKQTIFLRPVDYETRQSGFFAHRTFEDITSAIEKARSVARTISAWRAQRNSKLDAASVRLANEEPPEKLA